MHDIKFIRENPDAFDAALARRGLPPKSKHLLEIDFGKRNKQTEMQALQARRNEVAKQIGEAMRKDPALAEQLKKEAAEIKEKISKIEIGDELVAAAGDVLERELSVIPNILADDVPAGADEGSNVELRVVGAKPAIANPKDHVALGEALGLMDFETAAKISGARFVVTRGLLARLERALAAFMLDLHTVEYGYTETNPPFLVKDAALFGTGQLPKFKGDLFQAACTLELSVSEEQLTRDSETKEIIGVKDTDLANQIKAYEADGFKVELVISGKTGLAKRFNIKQSDRYWLIPTAEVSLTNLVADSIVDEAKLPLRMTAHTPCFRSEAGSAGRDTRGMIRQHQFSKVELVSITKPEDSVAEHERMLGCAEEVLKRLGLHYRVVALCAGDTGFGARKTYDIEVWLPGQDAFREISSCSNCGDFQARRMKARFKRGAAKETEFVHTLNGSGLAVGRTLVAVLENYQQADGSIKIPEVLVPYMGGVTAIAR